MNHYRTTFHMVQDYNWSYDAIQNMVPYERDIYIILLNQWIEQRKDAAKK